MRFTAAFFICFAICSAQVVPGRYVVEMTAEPLGPLARAESASQLKAQRLSTLQAQQRTVRRAIEQRSGRILDSLTAVMNGMIVEGSDEAALQAIPGVANVYPVETIHADLDRVLPLHFVQEAWGRAGGAENAGAGVRIAILDTGITPGHAGFQDPSLNPPPGYPMASSEENLALTSGKIVVARSYERIYQLREADSVRDLVGHGTAVAMCAAGVPNDGPFARVTGVAPKAWLGVYKVFPGASGSARSDVIAKALDDALADGMDVVNMSIGSAMVLRLDQSVVALAVERLTRFGVIVVVSAGNSGPALGSVGNNASIPSAIAVGASDTDRIFNAGVFVPGANPYLALPASGPMPPGPISAAASVLEDADPCMPLPGAGVSGRIALAMAGACFFEEQLSNAEKAGAIALILYPPNPRSAPVRMGVREARLPAVMIAWDHAEAVKAALAADPAIHVRIAFEGVPFPNDAIRLHSYSSRGPTYNYALVKPDISATGYVYTAAQNIDERGSLYGRTGYITVSGTSFSAPVAAGAAAVLKSGRPGLNVEHYRSLLINSANGMNMRTGSTERVQRTGAGILNVGSALGGTIAAYPTSISFGIGSGTLDSFDQLTLTNVGPSPDIFTVSTLPYDNAPALRFSEDPGMGAAETMSLQIEPGQSKTIYPSWRAERLAPGEYQGQILIRDTRTGASALVPYWHGVPSNVVTARTLVSGPPPPQLPVGQSATLYFRLTDAGGIAVLDRAALKFSGTVAAGEGSVGDMTFSSLYPNLVAVVLRVGPEPGRNTFRISFGDLPAVSYTIDGVRK